MQKSWSKKYIVFICFLSLIVLYLFFIKSKNSISIVLMMNEGIIFQLIPFVLLFLLIILILKRSNPNNKIDIGSIITLFSVLVALIFFMFQNALDTINKVQSLQIVTTINCEQSKNLESTPQNLFSYDVYNQNIVFIMNQFGPAAVGITTRAVKSMEKANMTNDEQKLKDVMKEVKNNVCDELGPIMYSGSEFVNSNFATAIYKLSRDFLGIKTR